MAPGPVTGITAGADESVFYTTGGSGVSGYDGQAWRIYDVPGEALLSNAVRALSRDRDGFLWVGTGGGLQQFNPAEPTIVRNYTLGEDLPLTSITAIAPATISGVWFGGENGAALFDDGEWRHFTTEDGLADNQVQALTSDRQRRTWIGTRAGLSIWNGEDFFNLTRENGLPSDNVTALLADNQSVWIGTSNGGLYEFVQNQLRVYNAGNAGLLSDTVTALARAADGSLYVGSERGLARFEDGRAARVEDLAAVPVRSLAVDEVGRIWVGTENNGLYAYDGAAWQPVTAGLPSPTIAALLPDPYGALWVGGENGGLMRLTE
jgi:ligand-binding sensor domain-containing protein